MLRTRILTGVGIAVVVLGSVLWLDTALAALVFGCVWLIGAGEWAGLAGLGRWGRTLFGGVFALFVLSAIGLGLAPELTAAVLWLAVACWSLTFVWELKFPARLPRWLLLAAGFVVLSAAWVAFFSLHGSGPEGPRFVLAGLFIVWSADVGAFFTGRGFGRTQLAPAISPKKTWEGVAGGLVFAAAMGSLAAFVLAAPQAVMMLLAVGVALISVVGDLGVSMLKRWAGQKDSGVLLPGHGGILDRFDGVTGALPFYVLGLQFAHVLD